jgi:hypothetical protein
MEASRATKASLALVQSVSVYAARRPISPATVNQPALLSAGFLATGSWVPKPSPLWKIWVEPRFSIRPA